MFPRKKESLLGALLTLFALLLLSALPALAGSLFLEPEVNVIYEFQPEQPDLDGFGWVAALVGDLNGDGSPEFIISAPFYSDTAANQGKAYLYSGLDGSVMQTFEGEENDWLGFSVAGAGDVNDDGTPDYMISSPKISYINGGDFSMQGHVTVYSGADHGILFELADNVGGSFFGSDVAGVGDINDDGYDDILVGAEHYSDTVPIAGRVYLYSGQDGSMLWHREGNEGDWLGSGVGLVGDVNDDGVPDVAASARRVDSGAGQAYVFSGSDGSTLRTMDPISPSASLTFGRFFADGAGDVNNDGIPDLYIGDYAAENWDGRVYIFSGAEDGELLHLFEAEAAGDSVGPGRGIGDVNEDGHDDLIIAAWSSSAGAPAGGKVYLRSGADGSILNTATGTVGGVYLGVDALSVGDVNLDGEPDYLITGYARPSYVVSFATAPTAVTLAHLTSATDPRVTVPHLALGIAALLGVVLIRRRQQKANRSSSDW